MVTSVSNSNPNAWGQIKKLPDPIVEPTAPAPTAEPAPSPSPLPATEPVGAVDSGATDGTTPLTYTPPPRPVSGDSRTAAPSLNDRLLQAGFYTASAAVNGSQQAHGDTEQRTDTGGAALSQAQIIAQAAYGLVSEAGEQDPQKLGLAQFA